MFFFVWTQSSTYVIHLCTEAKSNFGLIRITPLATAHDGIFLLFNMRLGMPEFGFCGGVECKHFMISDIHTC